MQLAPQDVEVVGRRRAVGDLPIVLGRQLQVALEPRRGMLRALAFIAMRQQQGQARHAQPFAFAAGDELVDDPPARRWRNRRIALPTARARWARPGE